jgi:hypothetical protein
MEEIPKGIASNLLTLVVGIPIALFNGFLNPPRPTIEEQLRSQVVRLTSTVGSQQRDNSYLSSKLRQSALENERKDQLILELRQQLDFYIKRCRSLELQLQEAQAKLRRR